MKLFSREEQVLIFYVFQQARFNQDFPHSLGDTAEKDTPATGTYPGEETAKDFRAGQINAGHPFKADNEYPGAFGEASQLGLQIARIAEIENPFQLNDKAGVVIPGFPQAPLLQNALLFGEDSDMGIAGVPKIDDKRAYDSPGKSPS